LDCHAIEKDFVVFLSRGFLMAASPITQLRRSVRRMGYSVDESASHPTRGPECWQVDATRDGRIIRAWAPTRVGAWELVCQMAGVVEGEEETAGSASNAMGA
jgi:hypothetical protein